MGSMSRRNEKYPSEEQGVSEVVGFILIIGLIVTVFSAFYPVYRQTTIHQLEADHIDAVESSFLDLKSNVEDLGAGDSNSANIKLGRDKIGFGPDSPRAGALLVSPANLETVIIYPSDDAYVTEIHVPYVPYVPPLVRISHDPIYIEGNANFTAANGVTGGAGTQSNPWIIENWSINAAAGPPPGWESYDGIVIYNTTDYFIVRNCLVENGGSDYTGIWLGTVKNGRVENNVMGNGPFSYGIAVVWGSDNNIVTGNTCNGMMGNGIFVWESDNNTVSNNTCSNNNSGIYLYDSDNINLTNNTCENNLFHGIYLAGSSNNTLTNNTCSNNSYYGICIEDSYSNTITLNRLLTNTENNAYDAGTNAWDNGSAGNYWSDWQPPAHPDANGNGIVDNARPIAGGSNKDNYPLVINFLTRFGGDTSLLVASMSDSNKRAFLMFSLENVPTGAMVLKADLWLYCDNIYGSPTKDVTDVRCYSVDNDNWSENNLIWENQPIMQNALDSLYVNQVGWISLAAKDFVVQKIDGNNIVSLGLKTRQENYANNERCISFSSKEGNSGPYLEVTYVDSTCGTVELHVTNEFYPSRTYMYEEGGVVMIQDGVNIMASEPTMVTASDAGGDNFIRVNANFSVIEDIQTSIASTDTVTIHATCTGSRYVVAPVEGQGPNRENVIITISSIYNNAWSGYLQKLCDGLNASGYNASLDGLTLTILGKNTEPGVKDIYYYETLKEIEVTVT